MMKRTVAAVTIAAVCTTAAAVALVRVAQTPSITRAADAVSAQATAHTGGSPLYTLREYRGKIAVFSGAFSAIPAIETDIDVAGLREYDRELLERGIEVDAYEGVLRLLEDFS
jgi:hypothetical protein